MVVKPPTPERQLERARTLRREQTFAEEMLWRSLRGRGIGAKFRRQMPLGPFNLDFACVAARLAVEVDGPSHDTDDGRAGDAGRDAWLRARGWRVLRVPNALVTGGGDLALDAIRSALAEGVPSNGPSSVIAAR